MSQAPCGLKIRRSEPQLIVPSKPTPKELKTLSDIDDQEGLRFQVKFIMYYNNNKNHVMEGKDPVSVIKKALSEALVFYYPLCGRLVEGPNKKLLVDCNSQGVLFVEAEAETTIHELEMCDKIKPPCSYVDELLYDVPGSNGILDCPLLLIQVTRLQCGGFVLAIRLNHAASDSIGMAKFFNLVSQFTRHGELPPRYATLPVWEREVLLARNPPRITFTHREYDEPSKEPNIIRLNIQCGAKNIVQRSFFFGSRELASIRTWLPGSLRSRSNFEVLIACLWRSRTIALGLDPDEVVRLSLVINFLSGKHGIKFPPGYYGSGHVYPVVLCQAGLLCKNPLGYALDLVSKVKEQVNEEYIRSTTNLHMLHGRPHYNTDLNYLVADTTRVGLAEVDFGWGKPVYGGPAGRIRNIDYFARFKNSEDEEGIVAPMWLPLPVMARFEQELSKMTTRNPLRIVSSL